MTGDPTTAADHVAVAVADAARVLRPHAHQLRLPSDDGGAGDVDAPGAGARAFDPAMVIAGLSLLMSVLTYWQTERHHRQDLAQQRRIEELRAEVGELRLVADDVMGELAAVPEPDLDVARAAMVSDPDVRAAVAALLGRAGVPVHLVASVLDELAAPTG